MRIALILVAMTAVAHADVIAVHDADGSAAGGALYVDGDASGKVPADVTVPAGKHLVQVVKGDRVYGAWLRGGATVDVALAADADRGLAPYRDAIRERAANHPRAAIALLDAYTADPRHARDPEWLGAIRLTGEIELDMLAADAAADTFAALYVLATRAHAPIAIDALENEAYAAEVAGDEARAEAVLTAYLARRDDDHALWRLATIQRRHGRGDKTLDRWRLRFGNTKGNEDRYISSFDDDGDIVRAWTLVGSPKHTPGARVAGAAALRLAEVDYASWLALAFPQPATNIQSARSINAQLVKARDDIELEHKALDRFGVDELAGASGVRSGDIEVDFASKVLAIPMPVPVANLCPSHPQICAKYTTALQQALAKNYAAAVQAWEQVAKANAASPWTVTAEERLYDYDPVKYPPPQHAPVTALTDAP